MLREDYKSTDGEFLVRAYTEWNRHGNPQFRLRYGYRGQPPTTETLKSVDESIAKGKAIWDGHAAGVLGTSARAKIATIAELLEEFLKRDRLSPASIRSYRQACGGFVNHVGADRPLEAIGRKAVDGWLESLTCKPISKQSYLRNISALFGWAMKEKLIRVDPTAEVSVHLARGTQAIRPWLQARDWAAFLAACGETHRIRAEFVLHTGLRAGELVEARWEWVQGTSLRVPAHKSANDRAIPLDKRALEILGECRAKWGSSGLIFGKDEVSQGNLRRDNVRACVKAGLAPVDFHGLRRSCGARWLEVGIPILHVSRMLGHRDISTTAKHYAGIADSTLQAEMAKVNALL